MTHFPLSGRRLLKCISPVLGIALAASSWAAISVSDVSVAPKPSASSTLLINYRLNETASAVTINFSNGTSITGTTARGMNTVEYTPTAGGLTATITATAPAEAGAGGAVLLVPGWKPDTNNPTGIDWFRRPDSPQRDHFVAASGYSVTTKKLYMYAADGTLLVNKDVGTYGSGSYPFGMAIAQNDPLDHVYVNSRSTGYDQIFNPTTNPYDLTSSTPAFRLPGTSNTYTGLCVTPSSDSATPNLYNVWIADNKNGRVRHHTADYTNPAAPVFAQASVLTVAQSNTSGATGNDDVQSIAVDPTNKVLFKAQVHDSGVGLINEPDPNDTSGTPASANIQKWVSTDGGLNWTADFTWCENIIGANGIPNTGTVSAYGVALDKGFDANNLANSYVWVAVGGGTGATAVRAIYHVRASDGSIVANDTIDLGAITDVATPVVALNSVFPKQLNVSRTGNIAMVMGAASAFNGTSFAVIAPNTASTTSDTTPSFSVAVPLLVESSSTSKSPIGNSGAASAAPTYTVVVYDPNGIVADNVQVSIDLSQIKGSATQALTDTVSTDGKTGTFTYTYQVPTSAPAGSFDLPVTVTATGGKTASSSISQVIYNAYMPNWALTTDSGVNSSPAVAGKYAYVGTDGGSIYAFDATTGAPLAGFGTGGSVNVGEPVKGKLLVSNGKLYAAGTAHVFIMDAGTGRNPTTGSTQAGSAPVSVAIADPSLALVPNSTDPIVANKLFVGSSDNKVRVLNATTGAQLKVSADLGARVFRVAVGPTAAYDGTGNFIGYLVVAGTDTYTDAGNVVGGRIEMLNANDLTNAFPSITNPVIVDAKGAVKSRAAFTRDENNANFFLIGGASGLWAVNADTGELMTNGDNWASTATAGSGGGNGDPYATTTPVDANPYVGQLLPNGGPAVFFGTTGGSLYGLAATTGYRLSYAGDPAGLGTSGGFAEGGGVLTNNTPAAPPLSGTAVVRMVYAGSDAADHKFFAQLRDEDGSAYVVTPDKKYVFDPSDTLTFPASAGYPVGAFNSTPAMSCGNVVVGSAPASGAGKVYGFPSLNTAPVCVSGIDPAPGSWSVASNKVLKVTFSGDMSTGMVTTDTFRVYNAAGTQVTGQVNQGADAKTFTFTPDSPWAANTTYYVVVSGTQDANGTNVDDFTSTFSTAAQPQPTVVKGDISGNGTFGPEDVLAALRIAAGIAPATQAQKQAGDLYNKNGTKTPDGVISIEDALFLNRVLNGKDTLP